MAKLTEPWITQRMRRDADLGAARAMGPLPKNNIPQGEFDVDIANHNARSRGPRTSSAMDARLAGRVDENYSRYLAGRNVEHAGRGRYLGSTMPATNFIPNRSAVTNNRVMGNIAESRQARSASKFPGARASSRAASAAAKSVMGSGAQHIMHGLENNLGAMSGFRGLRFAATGALGLTAFSAGRRSLNAIQNRDMAGALTSGAIAAGAAIAAHNMILGRGAMFDHLKKMGLGFGQILQRQGASTAEHTAVSILAKGLGHWRPRL